MAKPIDGFRGEIGQVPDFATLSILPAGSDRNFKSINRIRIIDLLVHLSIPKFAPEDVAK